MLQLKDFAEELARLLEKYDEVEVYYNPNHTSIIFEQGKFELRPGPYLTADEIREEAKLLQHIIAKPHVAGMGKGD